MLVLSRKSGESIQLVNLDVEITILRIVGNRVTVGVQAPLDVEIMRSELTITVPEAVETENVRCDIGGRQ